MQPGIWLLVFACVLGTPVFVSIYMQRRVVGDYVLLGYVHVVLGW